MPRRTIVLCTAAYCIGIAVQHAVTDSISFAIMAAAMSAAGYFTRKIYADTFIDAEYEARCFRIGVCLFTAFFILGTVLGNIDESRVSALQSHDVIEGRVVRTEIKDAESYGLILKDYSCGEKIYVNVSCSPDASGIMMADLTGRSVKVGGAVGEPDGASNPGGFDYSLYLKSLGVLSVMYVEESDITAGPSAPDGIWKLMNRLAVYKAGFENILAGVMDQEAAELLGGVMFGDDGLMDEDLQEVFRHVGTGHLLAVSGLHVGMVYGVFYVLLGKPVRFWGNVPLMVLMLGYAAVSGFSPSVVRAVFMIFVSIVARVDHRRYDFLTCIAFCAGMILLVRPSKLFASGFQLSFLAVLSLSVVMSRLQRMVDMPKLPDPETENVTYLSYIKVMLKRRFLQFVLVTVSLQLGMTPMMIHTFNSFSPAGLIVNSPSIALAGIIVPLGMLMIPFAAVSSSFFEGHMLAELIRSASMSILGVIGIMEEMLIKLLIWLNELADRIIGFEYAASPGTGVLVLYYFMLFFLCSETGGRFLKCLQKRKANCVRNSKYVQGYMWRPLMYVLVMAVAAAAGYDGALSWEYRLSDAVFVDVGQGDCCHIKGGDGVDVLCDSGGSDTKDVGADVLIPYFLSSGRGSIDLAVISHLHTDHYKGLVTMSAGVDIERLLLSAAYETRAKVISEETGVEVEDMIFARAGDVIDAGGGVTVRVLAPSEDDLKSVEQKIKKAGSKNENAAGKNDVAAGINETYADVFDEIDENEACLVYQVCYKGKKILFTGDIDCDFEKKLAEKWGGVNEKSSGTGESSHKCESILSSDILKVAHHGSRFSSCKEFLDAADPDISVIQVGRNMYGHPTQEAMDRITESGSRLYRNDTDGAVMADLDGRDIKVYTMK